MMKTFSTLAEALKNTASAPGQGITFIYGEKDERYASYSELYEKALCTLYSLQCKGVGKGDELLFQIENIEYFVTVFWACILGGIIPVPVAVGNNDEQHFKVFKIWEKLKRPHLITSLPLLEKLKAFAEKSRITCNIEKMTARAVLIDELEPSNTQGEAASIQSEDTAFIQFSSGSTGTPKGVVLKHCNLTANIHAIVKGAALKKSDLLLSWMPLTHDMGLIGFHLAPLCFNINQSIMPTSLFIRHPKLWMDKAHERRATAIASPNFGYQYFLKALENKPECAWDLSNIRLVVNGAEPISAELCEKFLKALQRYGLRQNAMFTVYGLAEASLAVTFPPVGEGLVTMNTDRSSLNIGKRVRLAPVKNNETVPLVALGYPVDFCEVRICDENNHALDEDIVGFINIKGSNVTKGYYDDAEKTAKAITGDGWLNTGDLGFMHNRRLVITGRAKDVIIVNGQNYYPHDIERVAEAVDGVSLGKIAAGSFYNFEEGKDSVVLFVLFKKTVDVFVPLAARLKNHIRKTMGLEIDCVVPVKRIPKTTSGKIQRYRLVEEFENREFEDVLDELNRLEENLSKTELLHASNSDDRTEETLLDIARNIIGAGNIGLDDNLVEFGGNSILLNLVHSKLEEIYPDRIKISDLYTYPTVRKLANYIRASDCGPGSPVNDVKKEAARSEAAGSKPDDIAIIGVAARLPIVDDLCEFWEGVRNGICYTAKLSEARRSDIEKYLNYKSVKKEGAAYFEGSYLKEIDKFDPFFFKISPNEATLMNPTQRAFLETVFHVAEDAGYGGDKLRGGNVGIYAGQIGDIEGYKYKEMIHDVEPEALPLSAAGNISTLIPNRISYTLDVKGPSMIVDTACSSSLVALHTACQAIKSGECEAAIVGSARISYIPLDREYYRIGIESSDYLTRTFDKYADGSGVGEGVVAVMIKPLNRALADGDNIYAVIKGSAVNQDGASMGITAPNAEAQSEVLVKAWRNAGIAPESLTYIEAHGTGTKIGDVIEIDGLQRAFSQFTSMKQFCAIGSVKSNLGHLYDSAGLIGLLKAVLSLKYGEIPPTIGFNCPNDKIDFSRTAFYVNTKLKRWEKGQGPRRCGVSSFGIGGTNCHLVLEEAPFTAETEEHASPFHVITLSAGSMASLLKLVEGYNGFLRKETLDAGVLRNICYTANTGRGHYSRRLAVIFRDYEDIRRKMSDLSDAEPGKTSISGVYFNGAGPVKNNTEDTLGLEQRKKLINKEAADIITRFADSDYTDVRLLEEICRLYVNGADIDWERLYRKGTCRRVSVPVYPYERKRCWIRIPEAAVGSEIPGSGNVFYKLQWRAAPLPAAPPPMIGNSGPVLIMKDGSGLGDRLAGRLLQCGAEVVETCWGDAAYGSEHGRYFVSNGESEYEALADVIKDRGITTVLHLFSYGLAHVAENGKGLEESQEKGIFCLFKLIKALMKRGLNSRVDIVLISNFVYRVTGEEAELNPENATLFGLGKVAGLENTRLKCRCIDVDGVTDLDSIIAEAGMKNAEAVVAYRRNTRYVEELDEMEHTRIRSDEIELKAYGVYVITGGLGGIGIEIARRIASRKKVNIALINRSGFPGRGEWEGILKAGEDKALCMKISHLKEMESAGSQVLLLKLDISKPEEVGAVFDELRERFGRINGVVHAAGIAGSGILLNKDIHTLRQVLLPKVWGTRALDKATEKDDPDFFVMFSSALTLAGDIGQADYVAANSYQDAFAEERNLRKAGTLTINWVEWDEAGMAYRHGFHSDGFFKPLGTRTGLDAFERLVASDVRRAIVGEINTELGIPEKSALLISDGIKSKLRQRGYKKAGAERHDGGMAEVKLTGREDGAYTDTEKIAAGLCRKVLGFAEINIYDSFFEMGADSILLKRIFTLLDERFPGKLSITDLFAYTSVYKLSVFLDDNNGDSALKEAPPFDAERESFSADDALECIRKM